MKSRCNKCASSKNLSCYSKYVTKKGNVLRYFICRECNTSRHKKWRKNGGMKLQYAANRRYAKKNKERVAAWYAVNRASLEKKPCRKCGASGLIHWHHPDPTKKLVVVPLCPACHRAEHLLAQ